MEKKALILQKCTCFLKVLNINKKTNDFSIYYTDDEVFVSMELGRVLEISSLEKLDKKLSEAKATTFVKE